MDLQSEVPYKAAAASKRKAFQPEFQHNAAALPVKRRFEREFQSPAPEKRKPAAVPELSRPRKVRRNPVRSARAGEDETRPASALKIQKVFRGYLVRKSLRKILGIKREVEAIELARFSKKEELDLLRQKDGKERLKLNEALMSLLFKLDAVKGYGDSGIRIFRKAVIKKAIALQEKLDSLENDEGSECFDEIDMFQLN